MKYKMCPQPCNVIGTGAPASMENFAWDERDLCLGILIFHIVVGSHSRWECERGCFLGRAVHVYGAVRGRSSPASRDLML